MQLAFARSIRFTLLLVGISSSPVLAQKVYWTDKGAGKIQRSDLFGSNVEDVVTGLQSPYGIAIDSRSSPSLGEHQFVNGSYFGLSRVYQQSVCSNVARFEQVCILRVCVVRIPIWVQQWVGLEVVQRFDG